MAHMVVYMEEKRFLIFFSPSPPLPNQFSFIFFSCLQPVRIIHLFFHRSKWEGKSMAEREKVAGSTLNRLTVNPPRITHFKCFLFFRSSFLITTLSHQQQGKEFQKKKKRRIE